MKKILIIGVLFLGACKTTSINPNQAARAEAMNMCHTMHTPTEYDEAGRPIYSKGFEECFNQNFPALLQSYTQQSIANRQIRQQQAAAFMQQQQAIQQQQAVQRQQTYNNFMQGIRNNRPTTTNCRDTGFGNVSCTTY